MLSTRRKSFSEMLRVQREEHATTRSLILSHCEELRSERKKLEDRAERARRESEAWIKQMRREGEERAEQMRKEGEERNEKMRKEGEKRTEELREFNREILLRNEKVYTAVIAEMEEGRKQIAANTKAVLTVLDRLNGTH